MYIIEFLDNEYPRCFEKTMVAGLDNIKEVGQLMIYRYCTENNIPLEEADKMSFIAYDILDIKDDCNAQVSFDFGTYRLKITVASQL